MNTKHIEVMQKALSDALEALDFFDPPSANSIREALMSLQDGAQPRSDVKPLMEWQPIETAPVDGTKFWGYKNGRQGVSCRIPRNDCEMWEFGGSSADIAIAPHLRPTHWMPLPDAPIEAAHGITGEQK